MDSKFLLIAFVIAGLSSCTTAYKIGQTPDDVYFSPTPPQNDYVQVNNDEDRNVYDNSSPDDREIRRRVNNRRLRRHVDYGYDYPYGYGYNYPYGYYPQVYVNPKTGTSPSVYKGPRKYNLGTYSAPSITDPKTGRQTIATGNQSPVRAFRPQVNNGSGVGNFIRKVFSNPGTGSSSRSSDDNTQTRTFEPSRNTSNTSTQSSSSSPSSSGGGNAPVRTFNK